MKSSHHGQQRSQDQDERLFTFGDPAFCRAAQENGSANYRTTTVEIGDIRRCAISIAAPNVFVIRVRDQEGYVNEQRGRSRCFQIGSSIGAESILAATKTFPREELFGLGSQIRRAAGSVGMNLMEGALRLGSKEYRHFVGIARAGRPGKFAINFFLRAT